MNGGKTMHREDRGHKPGSNATAIQLLHEESSGAGVESLEKPGRWS